MADRLSCLVDLTLSQNEPSWNLTSNLASHLGHLFEKLGGLWGVWLREPSASNKPLQDLASPGRRPEGCQVLWGRFPVYSCYVFKMVFCILWFAVALQGTPWICPSWIQGLCSQRKGRGVHLLYTLHKLMAHNSISITFLLLSYSVQLHGAFWD